MANNYFFGSFFYYDNMAKNGRKWSCFNLRRGRSGVITVKLLKWPKMAGKKLNFKMLAYI